MDIMNKPSKDVLEAPVKKGKCPVCGFETEPYYMKFHKCERV
jgi:hypothetical protein